MSGKAAETFDISLIASVLKAQIFGETNYTFANLFYYLYTFPPSDEIQPKRITT